MGEVAADPAFQEVLTGYYAQAFYRDAETTIAEDAATVAELKAFFAEG